jgi:hypothetical protein
MDPDVYRLTSLNIQEDFGTDSRQELNAEVDKQDLSDIRGGRAKLMNKYLQSNTA